MLSISLIFMPAFPLWRVAGAAALGGLGIPDDQQHFQIVLLAPHQDGTKQGRRCSHYIGPWKTSGPLSRGLSQKDLPRQYFMGHSGHMAEPT